MGTLNRLKGAYMFILGFFSVAAFVFLFYEGATGCGTFTFSSFNCWKQGLYPITILVVVLTGYAMLAVLRNAVLRFIHIFTLVIAILWFVVLVLAFFTPSAVNANVDPTMGGSFSNIANDDRYCCVYESFATPGDCPPPDRPGLNLTEICMIAVTPADLQWNGGFTFEFVYVLVFTVMFIVLLVLSFIIRNEVVKVKNDINDGIATGREEEIIYANAQFNSPYVKMSGSPNRRNQRYPRQKQYYTPNVGYR